MKKTYLLKVLEITLQQQKELSKDNYDKFIELLEERQHFINEVEEINRIHPLTVEERELVIQIKKVDDQNRKEYIRQFQDVQAELKKLNFLKHKNEQYINPYGELGTGIYFDNR